MICPSADRFGVVLNVAVADAFPVSVNTHVAEPVQAPVQPANVDPALAVAVSVTGLPPVNIALHVVPQLMPAGLLVITPEPVPAVTTLSWYEEGAAAANVAVTDVAAVSVTEQVLVPLHPPPDQPVNVDPLLGAAVSTTAVPLVNPALHVAPQLMPVGALVTVPVPVPAGTTVS